MLPIQFPSFDKMGPIFNQTRKDDVIISVSDINVEPPEVRYFTGLQVSRDPGVWVVYTGFILIIVGCFVTFFMSHRQICVDILGTGEKCRVTITGTANKNKLGLEQKLKSIDMCIWTHKYIKLHILKCQNEDRAEDLVNGLKNNN